MRKPDSRPRRRTGRPSKLTATKTRLATGAIAAGSSTRAAAEMAGLDEATFHRWMARGARGEPRFRAFRRCVLAAREAFELRQCAELRERDERRLRELDAARARSASDYLRRALTG